MKSSGALPWLLGGLGLTALLYAFRDKAGAAIVSISDQVITAGQEVLFAAALPAGVSDYARELRISATRYGVSPWVLAGIMYRESSGGLALNPKGPTGTGDKIPRSLTGSYGKYANAAGLPADGKGWGRGLMQIDYGVHNAWCVANHWWEPQVNIDKAASILSDHLSYFRRAPTTPTVTVEAWRLKGMTSSSGQVIVQGWTGKYGVKSTGPYRDPRPLSGDAALEAALAAYNAGPSGVLQALAAGIPPSAATAGNDYSTWVLARVGSWLADYA